MTRKIHGPGNKHRVTIKGINVAVYSRQTNTVLKSVGGCSDGCCDDYKCPDCGENFRVEWPD